MYFIKIFYPNCKNMLKTCSYNLFSKLFNLEPPFKHFEKIILLIFKF